MGTAGREIIVLTVGYILSAALIALVVIGAISA